MCLTAMCADPTSPGVWWRDDAEWKQYDAVQAAAIQKAAAAGALKVELGSLFSSKYAGGARYVVDLATMKQTNIASGFQRDVKIVKPVAAPVDETVMKELEACKKTILSLKTMVYKLNADVLALKLHLVKNSAKRGGANRMAIDNSPKACGAPGHKCEGMQTDQEQTWIDEFEDDLLFSDDDLQLFSGSFE